MQAPKKMKDSSCSGNTQKTNLQQFFLQCWSFKDSNLLEKFKENNQLFKVANKGKLSAIIFPLTCNLLKMNAYSNDFQKIFQAKNPCDCNQIILNHIAAGVNALNHLDF